MAYEFTQYELRQKLKYNPYEGHFYDRKTGKRRDRLDYTKGYLRVFVFGKYYKAHRLAWFYVYAKWPSDQIDHKDGNKANNIIDNLRDVNQALNMLNKTKPHKQNGIGLLGVCKWGKNFRARLGTSSGNKYGPIRASPMLAFEDYIKIKLEYEKSLQ